MTAPGRRRTITGVAGSPSATVTLDGKQNFQHRRSNRRRHQGKRRIPTAVDDRAPNNVENDTAAARGTFPNALPGGATLNIVGPRLPADVDDRAPNNVENGTAAARGTFRTRFRAEPPSTLLARDSLPTWMIVRPTMLKMAPPPHAVPPALSTRCFLHWPAGGFDKPVTVDRLTAHLDLLPTLADFCSLQLPPAVSFDGMSLKPLLGSPGVSWPERTLVLGTPQNQVAANPTPPRFGVNCSVMTDRWRLVNDKELYDMTADPGQRHDVSGQQPQVVSQLRAAYQRYWTSVSARDAGWRGRPVIGAAQATEVELCSEDWYPTRGNCPWNQAAVASGAVSFGHWPVHFAEDGLYRVELRRWPRELNAPMVGVPASSKVADAWLDGDPVTGTLYKSTPKALPVAKARLEIGDNVQESGVAVGDAAKVFTVRVGAGPANIKTNLLNSDGRPLCSAFYVAIRKTQETK